MPPPRPTRHHLARPFPTLSLFLIYSSNPLKGPNAPQRAGLDDDEARHELHDNVAYSFFASDADDQHVESDKLNERKQRVIGTVLGMQDFVKMVKRKSPAVASGLRSVHSNRQRMVWIEPEPDWFVHATIKLPQSSNANETHDRAASTTSNSSKATTTDGHFVANNSSSSSSAVHDEVLQAALAAGYHQFRLTHGRLARLASLHDRQSLRETLRVWWDKWTSHWNLMTADSVAFVNSIRAVPQSVMTRCSQYRQVIPLMSQFAVINSSICPILLLNGQVLCLGARGVESDSSSALNELDLVTLVRYLVQHATTRTSLQVNHLGLTSTSSSRDGSVERAATTSVARSAAVTSDSSTSRWASSMGSYLTAPLIPSMPALPSVTMPSMPSMPSMSVPTIPMPSFPSIPGLSPGTTPPTTSNTTSSPPVTLTPSSVTSGWSLRKSSWNLLGGNGRRTGHSKSASEASSTVTPEQATFPQPQIALQGTDVAGDSIATPQVELAPAVDSSALAEAMDSLATTTSTTESSPLAQDVINEGEGGAVETMTVAIPESKETLAQDEQGERRQGQIDSRDDNHGEEVPEDGRDSVIDDKFNVYLGESDEPSEVRQYQRGGLVLAVVSPKMTDMDAVHWMASRASRLLEAVETILDPVLPPKPPYPQRHLIKSGPLMTLAHWPTNEHSWSGKADDGDEAEITLALLDANKRLNESSAGAVETFARLDSSQWVLSRRTEESGLLGSAVGRAGPVATTNDVFIVLPSKLNGKDGSLVDAAEELRKLDQACSSIV
ncbi:hypothetical protein ACM66B_001809 [Microbotryomycetes sp. NB124-2]